MKNKRTTKITVRYRSVLIYHLFALTFCFSISVFFFIAVPEKCFSGKKEGIGSPQKNGFFFLFFFSLFKPKEPFILILHLPMTKPGQRKEKYWVSFQDTSFDEVHRFSKNHKLGLLNYRCNWFWIKLSSFSRNMQIY